ncbi:MAG: HlyD family secretion protein [Rhodobacter sp.]|nr:HlyD family secretion protein [Paracoccaceae bacterium]MCB1408210.1 HlyD family secretion protein [Paracoccaceae bacterium]MCC0081084.1 HlyD family secretion protein [Rhodobacter sp.]
MNAVSKKIDPTPAPSPAPANETVAATPVSAPSKPRKRSRKGLMLLVPVLLAVGGGYVWLTGGRYIETDNAYVHQPLVPISADVAGRITEVYVTENQYVQAGTPLFAIDAEPYRIALAQADAALAASRLQVEQLRAGLVSAQAQVTAAEALAQVRHRDYERQQEMESRGLSTPSALDNATLAAQSADNAVELARAGVAVAVAALGGDPQIATDDFPAVRAAQSQHAQAERNLARAQIVAPVSGVVSQIGNLNVGQYVAPGTSVASLVQRDVTWIDANFRETQLETLTPGLPVTISIDAYPDLAITGTVDSLGAATGSQFALIPAQNATGNWVKVTQRVPVRIAVQAGDLDRLRDGMSAVVSVDTGRTRLDRLR